MKRPDSLSTAPELGKQDADAQLKQLIRLRMILLVACLVGLIIAAPLWWNTRSFPLLPIASWFPILPGPWDKVLFGYVLASLLAACRFYRPSILFFLCATLFMFFEDQNRGQPWFYLYWVLMLLTILPDTAAIGGGRMVLSALYLWSGIHKLNLKFFSQVPEWFVSPALDWGFPTGLVRLLQWTVSSAAAVEILIGVGFWIPKVRKTVLGAVILVHGAALIFLGPIGHNVNVVVWPWNVAMIGLVMVMFSVKYPVNLRQALIDVRSSRPAIVVTFLVCLLPVLKYPGWWDQAFSFALYSGNQARADIFVSEQFRERLPESMRVHVTDILAINFAAFVRVA